MTHDTDAGRSEVVQRLNQSGFTPQARDQILRVIDAMMTGRAPLAHVLVAATEVCRACELSGTHQRVADALACLAGEVRQYQNLAADDRSGPALRARAGVACWNPKRRVRDQEAPA
jgi:hypothetical protein